MFDFLGRRKVDRRTLASRRRGPVSIGIEQLEGREMLSSGLVLSLNPAGLPPLASMPRPIVGSVDPEAGEDSPIMVRIKLRARPEPAQGRWTRPWSLAGRFRRED